MAEIVGKKMSQYTSVDTLTPEQKSAFLGSAEVTVFGTDPEDANAKANYSVPLSEITPSPAVPTKLSDLTDDITQQTVATDARPVSGTAVSGALASYYTKTEAGNAFVSKTGYVATDNNYTTAEKEKLSGIESGAQKNVKPDWNAASGNAAEILNKPTIPTASGLAGDGLEESGGKLKVKPAANGGISVSASGVSVSWDRQVTYIVDKTASVASGSTTATVTLDNGKYNIIAEIPATVTELDVIIPETPGVLQECGFEFTLADNAALTTVAAKQNGTALPIIAPSAFTGDKVYQGASVNGLVSLAEFDKPVDPLNPLKLPEYTVRCKLKSGYTPSSTKLRFTLVDAGEDIYDVTKTANPTDWSATFIDVNTNLIEVLGANMTGVTNMGSMFEWCTVITTMPLFDTSSVTNMGSMFKSCAKLETVPRYDTSHCATLSHMFYDSPALKAIPLFDTSSCTSISSMFDGCVNVESGALALYQQLIAQANPPQYHTSTFKDCGKNNTAGAADLAQIASDWK